MPSVAEARVTINKLLEAVDWYAAFVSVAVGGLRWTWGGQLSRPQYPSVASLKFQGAW
jgi:hypothetical protein